jgi:hypothetical protein
MQDCFYIRLQGCGIRQIVMKNMEIKYIGNKWVKPPGNRTMDVVNPAAEEVFASIYLVDRSDVDLAVAAAGEAG